MAANLDMHSFQIVEKATEESRKRLRKVTVEEVEDEGDAPPARRDEDETEENDEEQEEEGSDEELGA